MKDLYNENYKTLKKEIKEDINKIEISHVHGLEELMVLKFPHYLKPSIDSVRSPSQFQ